LHIVAVSIMKTDFKRRVR